MNRIKTITLTWASTLMLFVFAFIRPAMGQQTARALCSLHTDTASAVLLLAMSDELGTIRCPRSRKKRRKVSRI